LGGEDLSQGPIASLKKIEKDKEFTLRWYRDGKQHKVWGEKGARFVRNEMWWFCICTALPCQRQLLCVRTPDDQMAIALI